MQFECALLETMCKPESPDRWVSEDLTYKPSYKHIIGKRWRSTWFGHCVGHGLWYFIIYELDTLTGKEANLKTEKERASVRGKEGHGLILDIQSRDTPCFLGDKLAMFLMVSHVVFAQKTCNRHCQRPDEFLHSQMLFRKTF